MIFSDDAIPGEMNDNFSSFHLKQGYMATFAENNDGSGFGFTYIAHTSDILRDLPSRLANKVSFIRVLPVREVLKKGVGNTKTELIDSLNVNRKSTRLKTSKQNTHS